MITSVVYSDAATVLILFMNIYLESDVGLHCGRGPHLAGASEGTLDFIFFFFFT